MLNTTTIKFSNLFKSATPNDQMEFNDVQYTKSNVIHHINRAEGKKKQHIILSIKAGGKKVTMFSILSKQKHTKNQELKGIISIKTIYEKHRRSAILKGKRLKTFPL